jgi:hypothetical protein
MTSNGQVLREVYVSAFAFILFLLVASMAVAGFLLQFYVRDPASFVTVMHQSYVVFHIGRALYVTLPSIGLVGAALALMTVRFNRHGALGSTPAVENLRIWYYGFLLSVLLVIALTNAVILLPILLALVIQMRLRRRLHRRLPMTGSVLFWSCFYLVTLTYLSFRAPMSRYSGSDALVGTVLICAWSSILISDCFLLLRLWKWNYDGTEIQDGRGFQFSLSTLMLITLFLGSWISGLVAIFRNG